MLQYSVQSIEYYECKEWLLYKHYAKRIPNIMYSFGLFNKNKVLVGVCTFGMSPSSTLSSSICGDNFTKYVIELNRLIVNNNLPKNTLSFFVSKCLKKLPNNKIIISFADSNMNHNGYIYQATNFIYTGLTSNTTKLIDKNGNEFHFRNIGHYQKNNKLNAKLIKKRLNEHLINKIEIANFLKKNKGNWTAKKLDLYFNYKNTAAHWFRLDNGFSFPSVDDWLKLKEILNFNNHYDKIMTNFEYIPCSQDIIKKLKLKKINILPKHRYIYFKGHKNFKKNCIKNFKLIKQNYPKGKNKNYKCEYKPNVQTKIF